MSDIPGWVRQNTSRALREGGDLTAFKVGEPDFDVGETIEHIQWVADRLIKKDLKNHTWKEVDEHIKLVEEVRNQIVTVVCLTGTNALTRVYRRLVTHTSSARSLAIAKQYVR